MSSRPLATFLLRCFWGGELHTQQMFSHIIVVDMFQAADAPLLFCRAFSHEYSRSRLMFFRSSEIFIKCLSDAQVESKEMQK